MASEQITQENWKQKIDQKPPASHRENGCGPSWLPFRIDWPRDNPKLFNPACRQHDYFYSPDYVAAGGKRTREEADDIFYYNVSELYPNHKVTPYVYWGAVRALGGFGFNGYKP